MATDQTPSHIRGFIAPFKLTSSHFWEAQSTLTQNGTLPGVAESTDPTSLIITTNGKQDKEIEVETFRGGHIQDGAGFVWNFQGDALKYGLEIPNKVMDITQLKQETATSTYQPHSSILLTSGETLLSYSHLDAGVAKLEVIQINPGGTLSSVLVDSVDNASLLSNERFSSLCEMGDKSIILAAWAIDSVDEVANVNIFRSTDSGASWKLVSSKALPEDIDVSGSFGAGSAGFELKEMRIAATTSQVMLLIGLYAHDTSLHFASNTYQYASSNQGLTFKLIDKSPTDGSSSHFYRPDVVAYNEFFIISYITSIDTMNFIRFGNAFDSLIDVLALVPSNTLSGLFASTTANRLIGGVKTMHLDKAGRLYIYVGQPETGTFIHGLYSDLAGVSSDEYAKQWYIFNDTAGTSSNLGSIEPVLDMRTPAGVQMGGVQNIVSVSGQGRQNLFVNWDPAGTNSFALGLHQISMGGWSAQQYGKLKEFVEDHTWGHNIQDYVPCDLPAQGGVWTKNTTGTPTETLRGDNLRVSAVNAETIDYEIAPSTKTNGVVINTKIANVAGSSVTRGVGFGCQIQTQSNTNTYYFEVIIGADFVYVYDVHAGYGSPLGSATGLSISDGFAILCYLDNKTGDLLVYYGDSGNARQYQKISGTLTTDSNSTQKIYWGIPSTTGTATTRTADYHYFSYGLGDNNGLGIKDSQINPRAYSAKGFQSPVIDGLLLSTLDGPAREGDTYSIKPQNVSPIERTLHSVSPSPLIGWRGNGVTNPDTTSPGVETIAWMMDTTVEANANTHVINDGIGLHLTGINFRSFIVQKYDSGVGWTTIATVDNNVGGAFTFSRRGGSLASLASNGPYIHFNECNGWYVLLDDGAGTQVVRKISTNAEGVLANTSSKKCHLVLEDVKNSDPVTGTAYLIPSSCSVVIDEDEFAGIRIQISSQRSNEGYFQIGTMVLGGLIITSPQYGRGRTLAFESNTIENTLPNGTLYSQKRGNGGRVVRIAWTDGVDVSALFASNADPNYWKLESGSSPIAAAGAAPTTMMGLVDYCQGSQEAVVYLPSIETDTGSSITINRYHEHILATLGRDIQIEHVIGDELLANNEGEVFRVSTIVLREVR